MNKLIPLLLAFIASVVLARAEKRGIDPQRSTITVHVYKTGLFSAFAHDHEIAAAIAKGELDDQSVEFRVEAAKLRVADKEVSEKDREQIQRTMEGPEVLDVRKFAEIHFRSTGVEKAGANRWTVRGDLSLHGQTRPIVIEVSERGGHYVGSAMLKQRDFGMTPVSVAGGTVKVKDQVKVDFDIVAER